MEAEDLGPYRTLLVRAELGRIKDQVQGGDVLGISESHVLRVLVPSVENVLHGYTDSLPVIGDYLERDDQESGNCLFRFDVSERTSDPFHIPLRTGCQH